MTTEVKTRIYNTLSQHIHVRKHSIIPNYCNFQITCSYIVIPNTKNANLS